MNKQDIEQWVGNVYRNNPDRDTEFGKHVESTICKLIEQCFNDLQGWVSVEDRLPKIGDKVLIKIPVVNYQNIESAKYKGSGVFVGAWCDSRGRGCTYKVDEWQPLPPSEGE